MLHITDVWKDLRINTKKPSWFHLQRKLSIKGILSCLCFKSIMNSLQRDLKWHQRCHRGHLQRDAASGHVSAGWRAIASRGLFCPVLLAVRLWFQKVFGWEKKKRCQHCCVRVYAALGGTLEKLEGRKVALLAFPHLWNSSHYITPMAVFSCLWEKWEVRDKGNTKLIEESFHLPQSGCCLCQENSC